MLYVKLCGRPSVNVMSRIKFTWLRVADKHWQQSNKQIIDGNVNHEEVSRPNLISGLSPFNDKIHFAYLG